MPHYLTVRSSTHFNYNAADYLCLHIAISADVEAVEDDVEVAGWSRHQQEKEVEVGVAEQTLWADSDQLNFEILKYCNLENIEYRNQLIYGVEQSPTVDWQSVWILDEPVGQRAGASVKKDKNEPYLIFVIFLHGQNFWRIKFTPKNANFLR